MPQRKSLLFAITSLTSSLAVACAIGLSQPAAAQSASDPNIYLNQGWSQEDSHWYWHFSQGSAILSYDVFLNLEAADSQDLFRSGLSSPRYGLIPDGAWPYNPDELPVGFGKTVIATPIKGWPAGDYVGMNCAACHSGQLRYKGKLIRIEGGVVRLDLQGVVRGLDDALQATLTDATKFERLARRLGASTPDAMDKLRKRIEYDSERVHMYATRTSISPHPWGPGRMDAPALIVGRSTGVLTGIHENSTVGIAPTKPPFLWNAPHGLWTQWNASVQDPFLRNFDEAMGVWLALDLTSKSPAEGLFQSSVSILELQRVENQLERLAPPSWPEDVLGKIDRDKAKLGKALFVEHCASCHNVWPYRWSEPNKYGKRFILVGLIPQSYVGTDQTQGKTLKQFAITGELSKFLAPEVRGKPVLPPNEFMHFITDAIQATALQKLNLTEAQIVNLHAYRELPSPRPPEDVYKAAPRDGVWATAPFIHNGSVPNLYEMLIPAAERTKKFYLGGDFDPVRVGIDTKATSGTFLIDTTQLGSSNAGHSFENRPRGNGVVGPLLTEDDRWALVEYLKSIPEQPGRVTPFGGPPAN